jgi:L-aspartate oxidase
LLEGLLWGDRAGRSIRDETDRHPLAEGQIPAWDTSDLRYDPDPALIQGDMQTIRTVMWHYVGLVRSEYRLIRAIRELSMLRLSIEDFYRRARLTDGLIGLRNAVQAAILVAQAARHNRTGRGCHYRDDTRPWSAGEPPLHDDPLEPADGSR